jgi:hypothetical protein
MGNTFLVTKYVQLFYPNESILRSSLNLRQPQFYAGSGPPPVITTQRPYYATTSQYQSVTDYPGILPFTLKQTPTTSVRPFSTTTYGQSYLRTSPNSYVTQTSTLKSDQQSGWPQGSGYPTTQRSFGYETTSKSILGFNSGLR